ncbi:Uncharacterised protein [Mycobacteroides abscessus subsp. massiliense]|nr:Uncharacterised protein [Mycobacteroides abscessus subsp. massiliense]
MTRTHGSAYLQDGATLDTATSPVPARLRGLTSADGQARNADAHHNFIPSRPPAPRGSSHVAARPRIDRDHDVPLVLDRVGRAADELGVRCGTRSVLTAVLELLCGWCRVRDDQVQLEQVVQKLPTGKALATKTVARQLGRLHALELIQYRHAQGRGRFAEVRIHPRFLDGIVELERDQDGAVIPKNVPFSEHTPISLPTKYPLSPNRRSIRQRGDSRPHEVKVPPKAVGRVLNSLPECYRQLPPSLRFRLGWQVKSKLRLGWREDQVISTLAAGLPEEIHRPFKLGTWRLARCMPGAGPELIKLQQRWDRLLADHQRRELAKERDAAYEHLAGQLSSQVLDNLAAAVRAERVESTPEIYRANVVGAARTAQRKNPELPLSQAVKAWLSERSPELIAFEDHRPRTDSWWLRPGGGCIGCGDPDAPTRTQMPLPAPMCSDCWIGYLEEFRSELQTAEHITPHDEVLEGACA